MEEREVQFKITASNEQEAREKEKQTSQCKLEMTEKEKEEALKNIDRLQAELLSKESHCVELRTEIANSREHFEESEKVNRNNMLSLEGDLKEMREKGRTTLAELMGCIKRLEALNAKKIPVEKELAHLTSLSKSKDATILELQRSKDLIVEGENKATTALSLSQKLVEEQTQQIYNLRKLHEEFLVELKSRNAAEREKKDAQIQSLQTLSEEKVREILLKYKDECTQNANLKKDYIKMEKKILLLTEQIDASKNLQEAELRKIIVKTGTMEEALKEEKAKAHKITEDLVETQEELKCAEDEVIRARNRIPLMEKDHEEKLRSMSKKLVEYRSTIIRYKKITSQKETEREKKDHETNLENTKNNVKIETEVKIETIPNAMDIKDRGGDETASDATVDVSTRAKNETAKGPHQLDHAEKSTGVKNVTKRATRTRPPISRNKKKYKS